MSNLASFLRAQIEEAASALPEISYKRMFGGDAFFANTNMFAIVTPKEPRIGVKITDPGEFEHLLAMPGAEKWSPDGKMVMGGLDPGARSLQRQFDRTP